MGGTQSNVTTLPYEQSSNQTASVESPNSTENAPKLSDSDRISDQTLSIPMEIITKQTYNESVYVMCGKDGDRSAWHIILVPYEKLGVLEQKKIGPLIQVEDFGRNIEYRDKTGVICQASGYGTSPPEQLTKWINENYDPCTINENTSLNYTIDDIRLCTMHRGMSKQSFGIFPYYHRHERFHYIILSDDYASTLAFRAGIKSFDRVIEYNGSNIEGDTAEDFKKRIDNTTEQLCQLLVCSPATYAHYKKNNKQMHSNLKTVKRLKPIPNMTNTIVENKDFCAVRWKDNHAIGVILLSSVCKPSQLVQLYATYIIEFDGRQRKGQIIRIGSQNECELLQKDDLIQSITLVNSEAIVNNYESDIFQEIDDALFVTAYQQVPTNTIENRSLPSDKESHNLQVSIKEADVLNEKQDSNKNRREREQQKLIQQLASLLIDNRNNAGNSVEIHHAQCNGCGSLCIHSDRYKCLECNDFNLCGKCFDQRCQALKHISGHIVVHFSGPNELFGEPVVDINTTVTLSKFKEKYAEEVHTDVECNNCKMIPIKGLRLKCDVCHDYNLCITCMEKHEHDQLHPLLAVGKSRFLEISINDIELNDELGRGGFGTVYKAKWLSKNRQVACKVISVPPNHEHLEKSFRKELAAYAELSGPYILKTYGYNIQELPNSLRKCMLVMEFMPRGSLSNVLRQAEKMPLRRKLEMACQVASGMRKIHMHRMIHRDIRPDNILVTHDYTAKIGDMGLTRVWLPDENLTLVGCLGYMPYDFYTGKYDQSLDIYTFGLTINELFTEQKHQFNLLTRRITLKSQSPIFVELISRCLQNDPSQRPSALEIETTLRMYKQAFEKYVVEKNIKYADMSIEDKNSTFITTYETLHSEIDQILKHKFPPASSHQKEKLATGPDNEAAQILKVLELLQHLVDR